MARRFACIAFAVLVFAVSLPLMAWLVPSSKSLRNCRNSRNTLETANLFLHSQPDTGQAAAKGINVCALEQSRIVRGIPLSACDDFCDYRLWSSFDEGSVA